MLSDCNVVSTVYYVLYLQKDGDTELSLEHFEKILPQLVNII